MALWLPLLSYLLAALPAIAAIARFLRSSGGKRGYVPFILQALVLGFLAIVAAALAQYGLGPSLARLPPAVAAFIRAPLVEECVKTLALIVLIAPGSTSRGRGRAMEGAVVLGLGFAFIESLLYGYGSPGILILRAVTASPLHAIAACLTAYGPARWRDHGRAGAKAGAALGGLLAAVLVHGLYDLCLSAERLWAAILVLPLLIAGAFAAASLFKRARAADSPPELHQASRYKVE